MTPRGRPGSNPGGGTESRLEMEDEHPYEYYETQLEERSGLDNSLVEPPAPPRQAGPGWELRERFRSGALLIFRWRRKKVSREATKAKT